MTTEQDENREALKQEIARRLIEWEDSEQLASELAADILELMDLENAMPGWVKRRSALKMNDNRGKDRG